MPVKIEDGELLYFYLNVLIPNLSHYFSDISRFTFAEYEARGFHYVFETDDEEKPIKEVAAAVYLFEGIAATLYKYLTPFIDKDGNLRRGGIKSEIGYVNGNSSNNGTSGNTNKNMSENSPVNDDINSIVTPTYKSVNTSENSNEYNREYSDNINRETSSPEYIKEFLEIKDFYLDILKKELEKWIYEFRLVY